MDRQTDRQIYHLREKGLFLLPIQGTTHGREVTEFEANGHIIFIMRNRERWILLLLYPFSFFTQFRIPAPTKSEQVFHLS